MFASVEICCPEVKHVNKPISSKPHYCNNLPTLMYTHISNSSVTLLAPASSRQQYL